VSNYTDFLWKTIGRYDGLINGAKVTAGAIITLNVFYMGAIGFHWATILGPLPADGAWIKVATVFVAAGSVLSVVAFASACAVLVPYLKSHKAPGSYHSLVFFMHVAEHKTHDEYHARLKASSEDDRDLDLAYQVHAVGQGLDAKYRHVGRAAWVTLGGPIATSVCLVIERALFAWLGG
jgi:hypothetical protein